MNEEKLESRKKRKVESASCLGISPPFTNQRSAQCRVTIEVKTSQTLSRDIRTNAFLSEIPFYLSVCTLQDGLEWSATGFSTAYLSYVNPWMAFVIFCSEKAISPSPLKWNLVVCTQILCARIGSLETSTVIHSTLVPILRSSCMKQFFCIFVFDQLLYVCGINIGICHYSCSMATLLARELVYELVLHPEWCWKLCVSRFVLSRSMRRSSSGCLRAAWKLPPPLFFANICTLDIFRFLVPDDTLKAVEGGCLLVTFSVPTNKF